MTKIWKDGKSSNEKYMFSLLCQLNIDFDAEYMPKWCKYTLDGEVRTGRYDFYFEINNKKYIVEMDGEHHGIRKIHPKSVSVLKQRIIDDIKSTLSERQGIEVIRISCYSVKNIVFVKDLILKSKLNDLFDLSVVDWNRCLEESCDCYIRKSCELKSKNQDLTTTEISNIMKLGKTTIKKYLTIGNELGWCYYNPNEEWVKSLNKGREVQGNPICVFDQNKKFVGVFKNSLHFSKIGLDLFGIRFDAQNVRRCCNGGTKHHKKFSFLKTSRNNYEKFMSKYKSNENYLDFIGYFK